jgi:hypothetical protein
VIGVCVQAVLAGLVAVVRWGGLTVEPPAAPERTGAGDPDDPPAVALVVRRYLWAVNLAVVAGVGAGVLAAGAGGRLVMRLLAVTAGEGAQGRITEADQVVGRISAGGTAEFVVFTALFFGTATGAVYLLVRRWLPAGRAGGLVYGALLLLGGGTRLEPLRASNLDFDLVGPGWVSVVAFSALVVFHGMLVAALAGRASRAIPLLGRDPRAFAAHAPCCCSPRWRRSSPSWSWWACWPPWPPGPARWSRPGTPAGSCRPGRRSCSLPPSRRFPASSPPSPASSTGASGGTCQWARRNPSTTSPRSRLKVLGSSSMRKCPTPGRTTARTPWCRSASESVAR